MYGVGGERELAEESLPHLSGYEGALPVRIGNAAYRQQQNDVWGAFLDSVYLHARSREQLPESLWPVLKRQVEQRRRALGGARPRHLGGARRAAALRVEQADVLGRPRPRRAAGPDARRAGVRRRSGRRSPTRSTPTSAPTASTTAASSPSATATTALDASLLLMPLMRFLPADDAADPGHRPGHRRRADRRRPGPALPGRGDRRRAERRGGHVHDLLVLAGLGPGRDRRAGPGPQAVRAAAGLRQPAGAVRRGDRHLQRPAPGQLPAGVHPPGPDQRGGPRDPGRAVAGPGAVRPRPQPQRAMTAGVGHPLLPARPPRHQSDIR